MKVIISGVTGLIGSEVLHQCIDNDSITHIFTLSRRPLPQETASNPKVTSIIQSDFTTYTPEIIEQLAGAEACIWTLGSKSPRVDPRPIDVGFTQAAAQAFEEHLAPKLSKGKKFRFLHLSGILAEKNQDRSLWFLPEMRKSRGASEVMILDFASKHTNSFESYVTRAGFVAPKDSWLLAWLPSAFSSVCISTDQLAAAMIDIVTKDGEGKTYENPNLHARGKQLLTQRGGK